MIEKDFKKLIALRTLRHLGFILSAFRLGALSLSFFHLLAHALFKSLLFIIFGSLIIKIYHSQSREYITNTFKFYKKSSLIILVPIFNLVGLPRIRGYYTKDFILENFIYSNFSIFLYFIILVNVLLTYLYRFKLIAIIFNFSKRTPFSFLKKFERRILIRLILFSFFRIKFRLLFLK